MSQCTLVSQLELVSADIGAYRALQRYHYCEGALGPYCAIYALTRRAACCTFSEGIAGVIVYAPSPLNNAARDIATGGFFARCPKAEKLALLNAHVRRISRVIIEPRHRGLGLAVRLVRDTLPTVGATLIETSAAMGYLHPFFERAGMRAFAPSPDAMRDRLCQTLIAAGIDELLWIDPATAQERLDGLAGPLRDEVDQAMRLFVNRFGQRRAMPPGLERTAFVLNRLGPVPRYYAWLNPQRPVAGLSLCQPYCP